MLRLLERRADPAILISVGLIGIEAELAHYLEQRLRAHWPHSRIVRADHSDALARDPPQLWIHAAEPALPILGPTLWLAEIDRSRAAVRLAHNLWRSGTPLTGRRLVRIVESMLQ